MRLERTLPAVWQLHGADVPALAKIANRRCEVVVEDVEYLCAAIVRDVCRMPVSYTPRTYTQMDDLLAWLIGQVPLLVTKYDPSKGRKLHDPHAGGFRGWLYVELKRDMIDECRHRFGRDGHKHDLLDLRPFEREEENERARQLDHVDPNEDGIRSFADRLVSAIEGITYDDPDHWFDGRGWGYLRRDRTTYRKKQALGVSKARAAERRNRAAGEERAA